MGCPSVGMLCIKSETNDGDIGPTLPLILEGARYVFFNCKMLVSIGVTDV